MASCVHCLLTECSLAGRDAWEQLCSAMSQQLAARGDVHNAVLLLLALNDVRGAVRLYLKYE